MPNLLECLKSRDGAHVGMLQKRLETEAKMSVEDRMPISGQPERRHFFEVMDVNKITVQHVKKCIEQANGEVCTFKY